MAWRRAFQSTSTWPSLLSIGASALCRCAVGYGPSIEHRASNEMVIEGDDSAPARFASVSLKGKSTTRKFKPFNQDSYFYHILDDDDSGDFRVIGVCDGHGPKGHDVSAHIAQQISVLADAHRAGSEGSHETSEWLHRVINETANEMARAPHIETKRSGSTLVFSVLQFDTARDQQVLYTANVGDSRAIVCCRDPHSEWLLSPKQLNVEHSPKVAEEVQRVYANGGYVDSRGYVSHSTTPYGINMTRSLGDDDIHLNEIVSAQPDIMEYVVQSNDVCVVHGTDGIWDVMGNNEVAAIIAQHAPNWQKAAVEIVRQCEQRWRSYAGRVDDITITIIALD